MKGFPERGRRRRWRWRWLGVWRRRKGGEGRGGCLRVGGMRGVVRGSWVWVMAVELRGGPWWRRQLVVRRLCVVVNVYKERKGDHIVITGETLVSICLECPWKQFRAY